MKDDVYSLTLWAKNISKDFLTSQEFVTRDTRIQVFNVISSKSKPGCVCFPNVLATLYNFSCQLLHLSVTFEQPGQFWARTRLREMLFSLHCPWLSHVKRGSDIKAEALRRQIFSHKKKRKKLQLQHGTHDHQDLLWVSCSVYQSG